MKQADALVVLGAAVWPGGRASPTLEARVAHATRLLAAGAAPRMIVTGGLGRHPPCEAVLMRRIAVEQGADPERIVLEDRATSTFESARLCGRILRANGWSSAILVTDAYHLPRSLMVFRAFGVRAEGSASGGGRPLSLGWRRWGAAVIREMAATAWYIIRLTRTGWRPN